MVQSQYDREEILTYDIEEGTFTVNTASLAVPNGSKVVTGTFASQVDAENFLMMGAGENTLTLADTAADVATHFNPYEPEVDTELPSETTEQADLNLRYVGAIPLKIGEFYLPVVSDNAAIAVGNNLVVAAGGKGLDKAASATTQVAKAQEIVPQNTGGYIRCYVDGPIVVE